MFENFINKVQAISGTLSILQGSWKMTPTQTMHYSSGEIPKRLSTLILASSVDPLKMGS